MSVNINQKIQAIKESAKLQLTEEADFYNKIPNYIQQVNFIRESNKHHNEEEGKELLKAFYQEKKQINEQYEANKAEMTIKDKINLIENAYVKYAKKNAALDRLGKATVFFDAMTGMYVRISRYVDVDTEGNEHDRILTDRLKDTTVYKYIDRESKELAGIHVNTKNRTAILRELRVFRKEFAPLKPAFYGEFFNTYIPNGFLDVKVDNVLNVDKFTTITLPKRYPIINALLENIAPYEDERVFLLNWLSTILNTAKKTKTAIVLKGIQRTGKGVFASKIIEYAMHESNCFIATNANLTDNFNNFLEDKLFITFDEVKGDFNKEKDITNKIKLIVSEESIQIRAMHTNPYMIRFNANCIFLSNEDLPISMDQSDERLSVIETNSKTLLQVAREMGYEIAEFISLIEKERDQFLVHLKMCNYSKQLAMSTIQNKTKKAIQDATSTTQSVLKTAFRSHDLETISEILDEAITDTMSETLIKQEIETLTQGEYEMMKVKKTIPFPYNNAEMKIMFMDEFKAGFISNTSLKWFSKVTNIEHILKSDTKFGNFWNLVLTKASIIKLRWKENRNIDGTTKLIDVEHGERFRAINQHELPTTFYFNKKTFIFSSSKIAVEQEQQVF